MMTLLLIAALIAVSCIYPFLAGYLMYTFAAKGTKLRFIARTILRPTQFPSLLYFVYLVGDRGYHHEWLWFVLDIWNVYWISKHIKNFYDTDDEDDMWKRMKKKLRKWAKSIAAKAREFKPVLTPAPIPATNLGRIS